MRRFPEDAASLEAGVDVRRFLLARLRAGRKAWRRGEMDDAQASRRLAAAISAVERAADGDTALHNVVYAGASGTGNRAYLDALTATFLGETRP